MSKGKRSTLEIHSNVMDKQAEASKKSVVYSTKRINAILNDADNGKFDLNPFFHGSTDWRDAGVIFEYTDEELAEIEKCANDCVYFVEHYCKFLNKKGRTLVKLYDFQKENLKAMSSEHWDPKEEVVMPDNPEIVIMQSRQTSKCLSLMSTIFSNDIKLNNKYNIFNFIYKKFKNKIKQILA